MARGVVSKTVITQPDSSKSALLKIHAYYSSTSQTINKVLHVKLLSFVSLYNIHVNFHQKSSRREFFFSTII